LRNGGNYIFCLKNDLSHSKNIQICFVLISRDSDHAPIKKELDKMGITSQFMLHKNISKKVGTMGVISNLLRQVNAKCGLDLYRMSLAPKVKNANTMIVGIDVINMGRNCVVGMAASYNQHIMQYYSEVSLQDLHRDKENMTQLQRAQLVCDERQ